MIETESKRHEARLGQVQTDLDGLRTVIADVKQKTHGASSGTRKKLARTLMESQAELVLLDEEKTELEATLPALVEGEARADAQRRVEEITAGVPDQMEAVRKADAKARTLADQYAKAITASARRGAELVVGQREIRILSLRHNLPLPPMVDDPESQDTLPGPLRAARTAPSGLKPFRPVRIASDSPEERRRKLLRQMQTYVQKHRGVLSRDTLAIFDRCGFPGVKETDAERTHREKHEKRRREEREDFAERTAGPIAAAQGGTRQELGPGARF